MYVEPDRRVCMQKFTEPFSTVFEKQQKNVVSKETKKKKPPKKKKKKNAIKIQNQIVRCRRKLLINNRHFF